MVATMELNYFGRFFCYFSWALLFISSALYEVYFRFITLLQQNNKKAQKYAPLTSGFDAFYTSRLYARAKDCFNRPISGVAGSWIDVLERTPNDIFNSSYKYTGNKITCLNLASYNYLGFASNKGNIIEEVIESVKKYGVATNSPRQEVGNNLLHEELEKLTAEFVGKEDAMVFGMGFGTNSTTIPALVGKGDLIISDSLNHSSIATGCRHSGASIRVFKHNDPNDLEKVIRKAIVEGQPRSHRPWKKILIVIEGIYSMEGDIANLPEIIALKKKYRCYLYIDEAHSIGALGPTGRGVCDHHGVDPRDVDILMGTYTKSFGAVGGYIAADKVVIDYLRQKAFGQVYENAMVSGVTQQSLSALKVMMGKDGTTIGKDKIKRLKDNSNYFRNALQERGFQILGDKDSPIIPTMIYYPSKIVAIAREALKRNMAIVPVSYPATPLLLGRVRFCLSASHTREDLAFAVQQLDELNKFIPIKYGTIKAAHDSETASGKLD